MKFHEEFNDMLDSSPVRNIFLLLKFHMDGHI